MIEMPHAEGEKKPTELPPVLDAIVGQYMLPIVAMHDLLEGKERIDATTFYVLERMMFECWKGLSPLISGHSPSIRLEPTTEYLMPDGKVEPLSSEQAYRAIEIASKAEDATGIIAEASLLAIRSKVSAGAGEPFGMVKQAYKALAQTWQPSH